MFDIFWVNVDDGSRAAGAPLGKEMCTVFQSGYLDRSVSVAHTLSKGAIQSALAETVAMVESSLLRRIPVNSHVAVLAIPPACYSERPESASNPPSRTPCVTAQAAVLG